MDSSSALSLIKPYFPKLWAELDPEDVSVVAITCGFNNSVWLCERENGSPEDDEIEPKSLILRQKRLYSLNSDSDTQLGVITYELGRRGIGPRLYGLIPGGTIQEYIKSHTLTSTESQDPEIWRDIAVSFARLHSITCLPLKRDNFQNQMKSIDAKYLKFKEQINDYINHPAVISQNLDTQVVTSFDFMAERDWLVDFVNKHNFRQTLVLFDSNNYLNYLVREHNSSETRSSDTRSKVVLIDFDGFQINHRGIDLGGFFIGRLFQEGNKEQKIVLNAQEATIDEKKQFLTVYQQELIRTRSELNWEPEFDEHGVDSIDNLLLESMVGQMIQILIFALVQLTHSKFIACDDQSVLQLAPFYLTKYHEIKANLMMMGNKK